MSNCKLLSKQTQDIADLLHESQPENEALIGRFVKIASSNTLYIHDLIQILALAATSGNDLNPSSD